MSESELLGLFISADGDMLALSIEGELFIQMYVCVLCVCVISCTCGWVWGLHVSVYVWKECGFRDPCNCNPWKNKSNTILKGKNR